MVEATDRLEKLLARIDLFDLSRAIKQRAMESFPVVVKTLDALHLANALLVAASGGDETVHLFSLGRQMNLCIQAVGLRAALA
ncbi:MAG: hypothetical protein ACLFPV_10650 [Spirochaetaceae bacterium]